MALYDMAVGQDMFGVGAIMTLIAGFLIFFIALALVVYVYSSFALMTLANRLKTGPSWLAWIPFANLALIAKMAKMPWWPVLLILIAWIPVIGQIAMIALLVFVIIWTWKVCEARNRPGWWAVLQIIPFVGGIWSLVMLGILAWAKK